MKVVILAGGKGTRLGNNYKKIPKPFIKIDRYSIIEKLIKLFNKHKYNNFIICCDNRTKIAKKMITKELYINNQIKLINTGVNSNTLLRIYKIKKLIGIEDFFLVYGDCLANINLIKLKKDHDHNKKNITMSCYPFVPDKGVIHYNPSSKEHIFYEKKRIKNYWVNIGFFIINNKILNLINKKNLSFEKTLLNKFILKKKVNYFKYKGIWKCMDHQKDMNILKSLIKQKKL